MKTEHKLVIFAITAALCAVLFSLAYHTFDSVSKARLYRECLLNNKEMVRLLSDMKDHGRFISLPTCYSR